MAKEDDEKGADGADKTSGTKGAETQAAGGASSSADKSASSQGASTQGSMTQGSGQGQDAIALLKADHRAVEKLFAEFEKADDDRKAEIVEEACDALILHTMVEEEIFYPACREAASDEDPLDEAQVEHDSVKLLIAELLQGPEDGEYRDAQFTVMAEQVKHHVAEEEKPGTGIFAKAQAAKLDLADLGRRIQMRKQQVQARPSELRPSRPKSFQHLSRSAFGSAGRQGAYRSTEGDRDMPRYQERDERGRFTDDDDRGRYGSSRSSSSSSSSGRGHGGWYGDPEGHSQAARGRGESRSYRDDDDDRDYRSRSRDDDDRGYSSRDRGGQGGWFGDPQGHSEASRRGWEERDSGRGSRSYRDDDDRGYRGRSSYDDDRGSSRDHGQGGWFGDSRGHAEAARRGWEERDGDGRGSRSYRDDDDRGYRSRSRDDDRGSSRDGGHGGWFGDSRGHSEAARRGWEDRR